MIGLFSSTSRNFAIFLSSKREPCLSETKSIYTLLRFEYNNTKPLQYSKLFIHPITGNPRSDSQDVWIYHTEQINVNTPLVKDSNFLLGMPGCDNKITYVFMKNGYKCINAPWNVKTYHYHTTQIRNYTVKDVIPPPYVYVEPCL